MARFGVRQSGHLPSRAVLLAHHSDVALAIAEVVTEWRRGMAVPRDPILILTNQGRSTVNTSSQLSPSR